MKVNWVQIHVCVCILYKQFIIYVMGLLWKRITIMKVEKMKHNFKVVFNWWKSGNSKHQMIFHKQSGNSSLKTQLKPLENQTKRFHHSS